MADEQTDNTPDPMQSLVAGLLIGGRSMRMGQDKSLLKRGEKPIGEVLADQLERITGKNLFLLGKGSIGPTSGQFVQVEDLQSGAGPLGGILALHRRCPANPLLILATDLYAMNTSALRWLITRFFEKNGGRSALWPRFPGREAGEPLAAIYAVDSLRIMDAAWSNGERSLMRALPPGKRDQPVIPAAHRLAFENVNTPAKLELVKRAMAEVKPIISGKD